MKKTQQMEINVGQRRNTIVWVYNWKLSNGNGTHQKDKKVNTAKTKQKQEQHYGDE